LWVFKFTRATAKIEKVLEFVLIIVLEFCIINGFIDVDHSFLVDGKIKITVTEGHSLLVSILADYECEDNKLNRSFRQTGLTTKSAWWLTLILSYGFVVQNREKKRFLCLDNLDGRALSSWVDIFTMPERARFVPKYFLSSFSTFETVSVESVSLRP
jgi:hypothetical protein